MNRSFDQVLRSAINKSKSKEAHAFPQSPRFKSKNLLTQNDFYNLTPLMMTAKISKKDKNTSQSKRFREVKSLSPGPGEYRQKSFLQQSTVSQNKTTFNQAQRQNFNRTISPAPNAYSPNYISEKHLYYTMGQRTKFPKRLSLIGPGQYNAENYGTIIGKDIYSKYQNTNIYKIGHQQRFKDKSKLNVTPSPDNYNVSVKLKGSYSFGRQLKSSPFNTKNVVPGPGAYYEFSEFAQRRQQLENNLKKLKTLVQEK